MQAALGALNGPGTVIIPAGDYLFTQSLVLPDSVILQGEADPLTQQPLTRLLFNVGENADGIRIAGAEAAMPVQLTAPPVQGDAYLLVDQPWLLSAGDHLRLLATDDADLVTSDWSLGQTGQIVEVVSVSGDTLWLGKPMRRNYASAPQLLRITPRRQVHLHCLAVERLDQTASQTTNVFFMYAVDCSITGIDSRLCNYAHVNVLRSARITIANSFFKDGHAYGAGGKAFGVLVDYGSGDCYVHQNNFEHLRHAMIVQAGANGNVFAYNRSIDPYWTGTILPANAAGDLVLHGNYPYMNLFEGNVVQNIVIDNSHGINGPFNTLFRNRAELYGIFMNTSPASNDQNFIGNQVTNDTSPFLGQYALQGSGHFTYGNQIKGTIQPPGTGEPTYTTLFEYTFPSFYQSISDIPPIRTDNWQSAQPLIEAQFRWQTWGRPSACADVVYTVGVASDPEPDAGAYGIIPNPASWSIRLLIDDTGPLTYRVHDAWGRLVGQGVLLSGDDLIGVEELVAGVYFVHVNDGTERALRFVKE